MPPFKMSNTDIINEITKLINTNYPAGSSRSVPKNLVDIVRYEILKDKSGEFIPHDTIEMRTNNGEIVEIDKNISKLLKYIWKADINTVLSCEDNVPKGYIWINFETSMDVDKFLTILFKGIDFDLDIFERACLSYPYLSDAWIYDHAITDYTEDDLDNSITSESETIDIISDSKSKISEIITTVSVRFPSKDYDWICERFEKYLEIN